MNVFKYFANLYKSKDALLNHVTLFSISGLLAISVSSYLSSVFGNIYGTFFDSISLSPVVSYFLLVFATMLFIFFAGYNYWVIDRMFNGEDELPELSLLSYFIFVKMLPVLIVWKIYEFAFFAAGFMYLPMNKPWFYVYMSVLICLLPFLNLIYSVFIKDFSYRAEVFSPITLFRVLNRCLGSVIILWTQIIILLIIPAVLAYLVLRFAPSIANPSLQSSVKLGGVCILTYLLLVIKFAYNRGLVEIAKNKLSDI